MASVVSATSTPSRSSAWGSVIFGDFENFILRKLPSLHSVLPWMNLVHRWVIAFLKDKQAGKARIWGRPLPDVRWTDWRSPVAGAEIRR